MNYSLNATVVGGKQAGSGDGVCATRSPPVSEARG